MSRNHFFTSRANSTFSVFGSVFFYLLFFVFGNFSASAQEHEGSPEQHTTAHEEKKFNAGEMIIDHIADAHDWHICDIDNHPVTINLPVILYSPGKGFDVFSSARFEHGHAAYNGYSLDKEGHVVAEDKHSFYDISITKNVFAMFIAVAFILIAMFSTAAYYKKDALRAPKGLASFLEPLILFIRDEVAKPSIGPKYQRYLPYLLTIFFFIFILNLFGLIPWFPGSANVTGNVAVTMVLALFTFAITMFSSKKDYWIHVFNTPGVPWWLKYPVPLMPIVEFIGVISKPIVLTIRLFANITAGHIIILSFFGLIFIFGAMAPAAGFGVSIVSVAFTLFMSCLELLVAFLQAYVFTMLSAMYFGGAIEEHHHEEAHAHH